LIRLNICNILCSSHPFNARPNPYRRAISPRFAPKAPPALTQQAELEQLRENMREITGVIAGMLMLTTLLMAIVRYFWDKLSYKISTV
jgi:hypothetical protein